MKFTILNEKKSDLTLRDNEVYNGFRMYFGGIKNEKTKVRLIDFWQIILLPNKSSEYRQKLNLQ